MREAAADKFVREDAARDIAFSQSGRMNLGPTTEVRFREAFAAGARITAKAAASLLGLDVDTLSEMTARGSIRAVPRGRLRSYSEAGLRAFLLEARSEQPWDIEPKTKAKAPTSRRTRALPFSERPGRNPPRPGS